MEPPAALLAGLAAGLAVAAQVGAVSLLLVEAAVARGPRVGVAAGMGVATADLLFGAVAAAGGGAAGAALASHQSEIRLAAAALLGAIALHGLAALAGGSGAGARAAAGGPGARLAAGPDRPARAGGPLAHYARFLAITAANPLTIVSFAAIAGALTLDGPRAAAAFAAGVGLGSAAWHLVLTVAAGHVGRRLTPRAGRGLAVGGRLAVLAIAAHLALGA
ncbi:MAG TPA: hypothetical protein VF520_16285 [Thermoleophilaceae bacterium]|jgi:threonine/homoserine/homoserine lactone efflux protein